MKLAYINYFPKSPLGITDRLLFMQEAANQIGLNNLEFIILSPVNFKPFNNLKRIQYKNIFLYSKYIELCRRYTIIEKKINLEKYDRIILRYPGADASGLKFMQQYEVITEHHTMELEENKAFLKSNMSLSSKKLSRQLRIILLKKYHSDIIKNVKGIIGVTHEIAEYEAKFTDFKVPYKCISNGINTRSVQHTKFQLFDGRNLNIAFMATYNSPWHGLNRILSSLNNFSSLIHIKLHLIGQDFHLPQVLNKNVRIIRHGIKTKTDLDKILLGMNIAISTMALYKNRMKEASPLKTRNYTARGLPFIIAYDDPDLIYVDESMKFFLKFPNNNGLIDFEEVIDFVSNISKRKDDISAYMRLYAEEYMDWKVKIRQYLL